MIWAGLEVMGEVPFTDVIIHSTVLATDGRRMSKSLGTGVDPLEMIDAHGADATRYGLLKISSTQDVRFSPGAIEEGRKLANKLWNVSRLILQNADGVEPARRADGARGALDPRPDRRRARAGRGGVGRLRLRDRDERALPPHLRRLLRLVRGGGQAAALRARAGGLRDGPGRARATARPAAPVLPHVTEEIWSHLPGSRGAPDRVGVADAGRQLPRGRGSARARAGGGGDVPAQRRPGRARLGRRTAGLRGRRPAGATEGAGRRGPRDRAPAEGDRPGRGDARQRAVRRERAACGRRRRSAPSSSASGASSRLWPAAEADRCEGPASCGIPVRAAWRHRPWAVR